ncbi:acylphosphatase [Sphingomonas zeicaulis]|uniref:acylphosphatase n=1 Tax=Sphingomonas zeicaulis TaxID=1632740 RepID=UPI003D23216F
MIDRRLSITGCVQNVSYREWFVREASGIGLVGWVRNRRDGSVEAYVRGSEEAVAAIVAAAQQGSPAARVEAVVVEPTPPEAVDGFERRATF